jgi:hypothetical protein
MADQDQNTGAPRRADPTAAAQDSEDAARQDQIKRDHDDMQRSAERVANSVSPNQQDVVRPTGATGDAGTTGTSGTSRLESPDQPATAFREATPATDGRAAARTDEAARNADAAADFARRVEESAPPEARSGNRVDR